MASSGSRQQSIETASYERDSAAMSIESLLAAQSDYQQSGARTPRPGTPDLKCCCGRVDCAFLRHNNRQLHGLERNVQTAAQLGQALLIRHENYMADAERERRSMTEVIGKLETEKRELEAENTRTIEENRDLLGQLEELNSTVAETDDHVKSLTATLLSTQVELQRLTALASRTTQLEAQLALLEEEQARLQNTILITKEDERSAVQRWKRAERTLCDLQDQIERIEQEAREERERHIEVVGRLERRRVVERELDSAAGRLKGAAAAKTLGKGKNGSSVVSHFVKDILQDNANLQMGIVELREMLLVSNEEVHNLREQLMMHQPVLEDSGGGRRLATLGKELGVESSPVVPQEVHVHHHYHAPPNVSEKDKAAPIRRPKKKRNVITPTLFNPPSLQNLRSPTYLRNSPVPSTAAAILSQTSVSIPPPSTPTRPSKRSSIHSTQTQSSFAPSSAPSSPPSVFDRVFSDGTTDLSRPTSSDSSGPYSPVFSSKHFKRGSDASYRSFSTPAGTSSVAPLTVGLHPTWEEDDADTECTDHDIVHNNDEAFPEVDAGLSRQTHQDGDVTTAKPNTSGDDDALWPTLRRSASHESILSISALDIPTAVCNQRFQGLLGKGAYSPLRTPLGIVSPLAALDAGGPVLTAMTATARPVSRGGWRYDSSTYNRQLLESHRGYHNRNPSNGDPMLNGVTQKKDQTIGRRVGGWVWGRWGVSPESSPRGTKPTPVLEERPPGVNQPGPIRLHGLVPVGEGKGKDVLASEVDKELLMETLGE
ncbi:MAG: hypothetical protein M1839_008813 [Geoglossum umbratile]|nr:MAG: hypothetical protein M1839_008813 [Geoglossum umbratile]